MNQPLISIITPLYNSEDLISETINSVLAQTYSNWEMIIVDDGSTDKSFQLALEYANKDERIIVHQRKELPKGGSVCRNIGLQHAKGEYYIFLDSDDTLLPRCLQNRLKAFAENPNTDFIVFQIAAFVPGEKEIARLVTIQKENYLQAFLSYDLPWQTTCPMWNANFFKKQIKGFNEKFPRLQDPELHTRALLVSDVKFKVFDSEEYIDSHYLFDYKKSVLKRFLDGVYLYITSICPLLKDRDDKAQCFKSLFTFHETVIAHYTGQTLEDITTYRKEMHRVNNAFRTSGIIDKKTYRKTEIFLFLIKNKLFNTSFFPSLLAKLGFKNFYLFKIEKSK